MTVTPEVNRVTEAQIADMRTGYSSFLEEHEYWIEDAWVEGQIPRELEGTYFRNGPGLQIDNEQQQRHTFDGDGMILSLAFKDGKAFFRNRFVRTKGFEEEQAAGKILYRNTFTKGAANGSRWFNPFDLKFKNIANTNVLHWAGKLYALWEGGLPHTLDPTTLQTIVREDTFNGAIGDTLAAHHRVMQEPDGSTRWVTFGTGSSFTQGTTITFYEFDTNGKRLHTVTHPLPEVQLPLIHDMAVTEHYYVVVMGPLQLDGQRFITSYAIGNCTLAECLKFNAKGETKVFLFPRPGRAGDGTAVELKPRVLRTQPFFSFHNVNAYEADEGRKVVVDTVAWNKIDFTVNQYTVDTAHYNGGSRTHMYRLVCDLESEQVTPQQLVRRTVEFPVHHPLYNGRPYTHSYMVADTVDEDIMWGPARALLKVSCPPSVGVTGPMQRLPEEVKTQVWQPGPRIFPGEPTFIPKPSAAFFAHTSGSSNGGSNGGSNGNDGGVTRSSNGGSVNGAVANGGGVASHNGSNGVGNGNGSHSMVKVERADMVAAKSIDEEAGWLICICHDAESKKAKIYILDAKDISAGPVATIHMPHHLPAGLHGSFSPAYLGPDPAAAASFVKQAPNRIRQL